MHFCLRDAYVYHRGAREGVDPEQTDSEIFIREEASKRDYVP